MDRIRVMDVRSLRDARRFAADKMAKVGLYATERLWCDLYCLEPGQAQEVHSHAGSDKVYVVVGGRALMTVGGEERELLEGEAALAPAGQPHGVRNGSEERLTVLVVTAPPFTS